MMTNTILFSLVLATLATSAFAQHTTEPLVTQLFDVTVRGVTRQVPEDTTVRFAAACGEDVEVRVLTSQKQRFSAFGLAFEYPKAMQVVSKREKVQDVIFVKDPAGFTVAIFFVRGSGDPEVETLSFFVRSMKDDLSSRGWKFRRGGGTTTRRMLGVDVVGARLRASLASLEMNFELFTHPVAGGVVEVLLQYPEEETGSASTAADTILHSLARTGT